MHKGLKDISVSVFRVHRRDAFGYLGEDGKSFEFSMYISHFTRHNFHWIWKNIVFEESCKTLSCFWNFLIGKMIVRISRCMYHARSSHQTLRTSTVYVNYRFFKEKAKTFYVFPFHWCYGELWLSIFNILKQHRDTFQFERRLFLPKKGAISSDNWRYMSHVWAILSVLVQMSRAKVDVSTWQMLLGEWVQLELTEPLW